MRQNETVVLWSYFLFYYPQEHVLGQINYQRDYIMVLQSLVRKRVRQVSSQEDSTIVVVHFDRSHLFPLL